MQILGFVFGQTHAHLDNSRFRKLVKHLLNDSVLPQHDRQNSPGRDAQLELYLAAICQNAGLLPVDYEEPDVNCTVGGIKFGIAAKRLKSRSHWQLEKHVRKAAIQIAKTKLPGIVALDLSLARNQNNQPIVSQIQSQMYMMIAHAMNTQFFDEYHEDIYRWAAGSGVRAVVVFDFAIRLRPNQQWGLDGMTCWLPTTHDDEQANREYTTFYDGFLRGVPNVEDLTAEV